MPNTVIPQGYAHVLHSIRLAADPDAYAITYGVKVTDPPGTDPAAMAQELQNMLTSAIGSFMPNLLTVSATEMRWQAAALPADPVIGVASIPFTGGSAQPLLLPPNNAFLIHKRTALGGRKGRGRFFFPGVPEGQADNAGLVLAASITQWNNGLEAWRAAVVASPNFDFLVLLHSDQGILTPDPTPITTLTLDPMIATQRRRLRK